MLQISVRCWWEWIVGARRAFEQDEHLERHRKSREAYTFKLSRLAELWQQERKEVQVRLFFSSWRNKRDELRWDFTYAELETKTAGLQKVQRPGGTHQLMRAWSMTQDFGLLGTRMVAWLAETALLASGETGAGGPAARLCQAARSGGSSRPNPVRKLGVNYP